MSPEAFMWNRKLICKVVHRFLLLAVLTGGGVASAQAQLRIEMNAAYNLVVDSDAGTPSSYAPSAAYLGAKFWNDGTNALTDVWAYIGDYANGTPGVVRPPEAGAVG